MHYKKHGARKYEVPARLFAPRGPRRGVTVIFKGAGAKSAPRTSTVPGKREPKE